MILGEGRLVRDDIVRGAVICGWAFRVAVIYCPAGVVLLSGLPGFSGSTELEVTEADVFKRGSLKGRKSIETDCEIVPDESEHTLSALFRDSCKAD